MRGRVHVCVAIALAAMIGSGACSKKKPAVAPTPPPAPAPATTPPPPPPPPPPPATAPAPHQPTEDEIFAGKSLDELNNEHPLGDAFFDLDSSQIRDDAKPVLQKDSDWLKRWTSTKIMIEGHCDERGTAEYNLALGTRRADALKAYLVSLGVPADRVDTVSKGKEQPFCTDHSDDCWQQNRRGHFIITAK